MLVGKARHCALWQNAPNCSTFVNLRKVIFRLNSSTFLKKKWCLKRFPFSKVLFFFAKCDEFFQYSFERGKFSLKLLDNMECLLDKLSCHIFKCFLFWCLTFHFKTVCQLGAKFMAHKGFFPWHSMDHVNAKPPKLHPYIGTSYIRGRVLKKGLKRAKILF